MLYVLAIIATLAVAGTIFLQREITVGTLFLLVAYVRLMESPIKYIRRQIKRHAAGYCQRWPHQ